jgi:hypothetical protein
MSALDRHPDAQVELQLRRLRASGWKIVKSRFGNFYDITCKAGTMNTRITARAGRTGLKGKTAQEQLFDFLVKHNAKHPGE